MTNKKPTIEFAPGCFDNFEGTQEELQELIAHIHQMVEDGSIFEYSELLTTEEEEEMWEMLEQKQKDMKQ